MAKNDARCTPVECTVPEHAPARRSSETDYGSSRTRWSCGQFLNEIRGQSDALADDCVAQLKADTSLKGPVPRITAETFAKLVHNDDEIPADAPEQIKEFFRHALSQSQTRLCKECGSPHLLPDTDHDRILNGQRYFMTQSFGSVLVLVARGLPEGYAAPYMAKILHGTGLLEKHAYRRLVGTLQTLINVSTLQGYERFGKGVVTALELRLLHAGIRDIVGDQTDDYGAVPVNIEDMLGTILAFSLMVVLGLRDLGLTERPGSPWSQDEQDFWYLWMTFGRLLGLHPKDEPVSMDFIPKDLDEANEFYKAFKARHYESDVKKNKWGKDLAKAHLEMLVKLLPISGKVGFSVFPRIYMQKLNGVPGVERLGLRPVRLFLISRFVLTELPHVWYWFWGRRDRSVHAELSRWFFQALVDRSFKQGVKYLVPTDIKDLETLLEGF